MVRMLHDLPLSRLAPLDGTLARNNSRNPLTGVCTQLYKNTEAKCLRYAMKTPPSGAQPLAAAVDGAKFTEIAGTIAGDDTVLIITPNKKSRESLQKKIEALVK